jgi:hypothetical protein
MSWPSGAIWTSAGKRPYSATFGRSPLQPVLERGYPYFEEKKAMKLEPEYAQNIIVDVLFHSEWRWYVTDRDWWFLDHMKWRDAFTKRGYTVPNPDDFSNRFDIDILNENTAPAFLSKIEEYRVEAGELSEKLIQRWSIITSDGEDYDILDFSPSLFVDFDHRILYSMYPEPASYEHHTPNGWTGEYKDFTSLVPANQKYWMVGEKNYFKLTPPGLEQTHGA